MTEADWTRDEFADRRTPYVDWWHEVERRFVRDRTDFALVELPRPRCDDRAAGPDDGTPGREELPLPAYAANPEFDDDRMRRWLPAELRALVGRPPPRNSVVLGIIDEGIAVGNARFRNRDGSTRFLAAWQQGARFAGQAYLPFGRELYRSDVESLFDAFEASASSPWALDEEGVNRAAGIIDFSHYLGQRSAARLLSHGTHVLDIAGGVDPDNLGDFDTERLPVIAVNLPPRPSVGLCGSFAEYFLVYALQRIVDLSDAIWATFYPDDAQSGFPIVLNASLGHQAGPKDGTSIFERAVKRVGKGRRCRSSISIVMPAGNDNLERCVAQAHLEPGNTVTIPWRILPDDHTSNFVEVWSDPMPEGTVDDRHFPLEIALTPPGAEEGEPSRGRPGYHRDVGRFARIYCRKQVHRHGTGDCRLQFVVCIAPTANNDTDTGAAPPGLWRLTIRNHGPATTITSQVQMDQAPFDGNRTSRRSYFDDASYRVHDDRGFPLDSFPYPLPGDDPPPEPTISDRLVTRVGSHNAIATIPEIAAIASYRESDGKPSLFSATARSATVPDSADPRFAAAFPGEIGHAHFGTLASGPGSGSACLLSGTSVAAPMATRALIRRFIASGNPTFEKGWSDAASPNDASVNGALAPADFPGAAHVQKVGAGRVWSEAQSPRRQRTGCAGSGRTARKGL